MGQDGPLLLENGWAFWYDKYIGPGRTVEEYAAALHNLGGFGSVQVRDIDTPLDSHRDQTFTCLYARVMVTC